jgi:hypothetical protein
MVWSHGLSASRVALASAALRHVEDAAALASRSPVQAYYLAGYGPECARKAALTFASEKEALELDKAVGHGFRKDAETAFALACTLDPLATRYTLRDWRARLPVLSQWNEQCRYEKSDHIGEKQATTLLRAATELVEEVVTALWADGRLPRLEDLVQVKA